MYCDWHNYSNSQENLINITCDLDDISTISCESLIFALCRFITEMRKLDGSEFPGKTLCDIHVCVQFHLKTLGFSWKLINEGGFKDVRFTVDNVMKLQTSQGIGLSVKQAQILSEFDEDLLWNLGLLGSSNPETLLNTMMFVIGKGFSLRAGHETKKFERS